MGPEVSDYNIILCDPNYAAGNLQKEMSVKGSNILYMEIKKYE